MTCATLLIFLSASLALTIAPGPDNLFVLSQGIARGRRVAIITALGMCSGVSVHTLAAACGISALFYSSALAFSLVKYAGAAYLLYLAWRTLRSAGPLALAGGDQRPAAALFRQGFIMNVLNPKVALFFLAFLPQFVQPGAGSVALQMLVLGLLFMLQAVVVFSLIGYCAGSIGRFLSARPASGRFFDRLSAAVFAALGLRLALAQR